MKIKNKYIIASFALILSFSANAQLEVFTLDLYTESVEGPAFGGVAVGESFDGLLAIETEVLQNIAESEGTEDEFGFSSLIVPLQDENDNFNLSYSINIGNYTYTEQTAGFFDSNFDFFNNGLAGVVGLSLDIGDLSFNDLEISAFTQPDSPPGIVVEDSFPEFVGTWSATDGETGNVVSGSVGFSGLEPSVVPIPATVWLFGSGLLGLSGLKKKKVESM